MSGLKPEKLKVRSWGKRGKTFGAMITGMFSKRLTRILPIVLLLVVLAAVLTSRQQPAVRPGVAQRELATMGTFLRITVVPDGPSADEAIDEACREVQRLNDEYSSYDSRSLLSRVNAAGDSGFEVTDEFIELLAAADRMWNRTGGRFDVTVGPLMRLWGFERRQGRVPSPDSIAAVLPSVGFEKVRVEGNRVILTRPGMGLDFGSLVKGYAVDRAAAILRQHGFQDYLVDLGGNMYASGENAEGRPWRIGIRDPRNAGTVVGAVELSNEGIATSGDYERMFMHEGRRYAHIVDPKTGYPVEEMAATTVICRNAFLADLYSTSCFLAGPEADLSLSSELLGVIFGLSRSNSPDSISWVVSEAFRARLVEKGTL